MYATNEDEVVVVEVEASTEKTDIRADEIYLVRLTGWGGLTTARAGSIVVAYAC